MKKKLLIVFILLALLTGCSKKQSKNELNVLNWSSYIPDTVLRGFEDETGIKLNYGTYSSNEELLAKVTSSKKGTYDLVFPSDYMVEIMKLKDTLTTLNKNNIEGIDHLNKNYLNLEFDPNNEYSIPFLAATTLIVYDKTKVKNIKSYNDLLRDSYLNNIVVLDDQRIMIGVALMALGYDMNTTEPKRLNEAKDWLLTLKRNIKAFDSDSPKTFLITHETDIGLMWNAEAAIAVSNNPNLEVVYPREGFAISMDNMCILKGAKNESNAYKFISYILKPEVMKQIIEDYPYKNLNLETDKMLDESYLKNEAANTSNEMLNRSHFVKNIGSSITEYDKIWAEIK